MTDGPFAETKEQLGGFWVIEAPDLDAALELGGQGSAACMGAGRGAAVPRRAERRARPVDTATSNGSSGRNPVGSSPPWSVSSATSTSPKRWSRRRSSIASERWPETGLPPNPGGWITTTARNRAIDRLRREASRNDRHAQAALLHESERADRAG